MNASVVYVRLESGVVIAHTRREYERLMKGVDPDAAKAMQAELK